MQRLPSFLARLFTSLTGSWRFILAVSFLALFPLQARAEPHPRVALVIGNSAYQDAGTLANPVNDALDIAASLRALGFTVIEGHDLGKREMERKVGEFADALDETSIGLFYYAGHGLGVNGRNYILPVDAKLDVMLKLQLEAVPLDEVLDIMRSQGKASLVFLDACSNNPFAAAARSAKALQSFAPVEISDNSFVAFSTQDGATAVDGSGRNSPFAAALLQHIGQPGLSINDLMQNVRRDVRQATRKSQVPFVKDSLLEPFAFVPAGGTAVAAAETAETAPAAIEVASLNRSLGDKRSVETFIRRDYLTVDKNKIEQTVRRLYAPEATIFGTPLSLDAIIKAKNNWFAQWSSWTLAIEPNSIQVTPAGADRVDVSFSMSYDYVPKSPCACQRSEGRARVCLSLIKVQGKWRIVSETSAALT